jgi:energy-converting hydrogenase Eha subunit F
MYVQALVVNAALIMVIPRIIQKPIGISVIDEFVAYLRAQQTFLVSSSLLLALVLYITNYWISYSEANDSPMTPKSPFVKE